MTPQHEQVRKLLGAVKGIARIYGEQSMDTWETTARRMAAAAHESIDQTEAWLAGESAPPSPINACIRAAKRVIAALNLPDGGGVAFAFDRWYATDGKPSNRKLGDGHDAWWFEYTSYSLPVAAIPTWPGDQMDSWITATTPEIPDENNKE